MLQGSAVHIGTGSTNALTLISDFMQTVADALGVLAVHNHGDSPPPNQAGAISAQQTSVSRIKGQLDGVSQ